MAIVITHTSNQSPTPSEDEALKLDTLQRDLLSAQISDFLKAAPPSAGRDAFEALKDAVEAMEVPAELAPRLDTVIELLLSSGRARRVYGPAGELAISSLFQKTSRGKTIASSVSELNGALKKLKGQPLEEISASLKKPGVYTLTINAGGYRIAVRFAPEGASVESVELGLG
ncbi:MAG TPA: hypothetical protein VMB26_05070 [Candidatus Binataceae bacterium]|nr:hypothetical protein [Candidatus Binataceae bacterium]